MLEPEGERPLIVGSQKLCTSPSPERSRLTTLSGECPRSVVSMWLWQDYEEQMG
jgi:hypothetical protein